jgi:hypothetical protein
MNTLIIIFELLFSVFSFYYFQKIQKMHENQMQLVLKKIRDQIDLLSKNDQTLGSELQKMKINLCKDSVKVPKLAKKPAMKVKSKRLQKTKP